VKLRIISDEVRLRLNADDIVSLSQGIGLRETVSLPNQQVHIDLACEGSQIGVAFAADGIRVSVPSADAVAWSVSDRETLSAVLVGGCRLLVEKDRRS
jgi:hypothetical protein